MNLFLKSTQLVDLYELICRHTVNLLLASYWLRADTCPPLSMDQDVFKYTPCFLVLLLKHKLDQLSGPLNLMLLVTNLTNTK